MKGKTYSAKDLLSAIYESEISGRAAYPIKADGKVDTKARYTVENLLTKPGAFVLLNPSTGKARKAKAIFVIA